MMVKKNLKNWRLYTTELFNVLKDGKEVETPLGTFSIKRKKTISKNISIDWKKTKELKETVYYFNDNTGGYKVLLTLTFLKTLKAYNYKFVRFLNRSLAAYINEDNNRYKKYEINVSKYSNKQSTKVST